MSSIPVHRSQLRRRSGCRCRQYGGCSRVALLLRDILRGFAIVRALDTWVGAVAEQRLRALGPVLAGCNTARYTAGRGGGRYASSTGACPEHRQFRAMLTMAVQFSNAQWQCSKCSSASSKEEDAPQTRASTMIRAQETRVGARTKRVGVCARAHAGSFMHTYSGRSSLMHTRAHAHLSA